MTPKQAYQKLIEGTISPRKASYRAKCGKQTCRVEVKWSKWNAGPTGEVYFPDGSQVTFDEEMRAADWASATLRSVNRKTARQALVNAMRQVAAEQKPRKPRVLKVNPITGGAAWGRCGSKRRR